ncbi:phage portal protein [uncultured Methanobrevibacter sp.]|uniref:phage portal protein n=1 Tax=uncultured Methanobrevibacter sp. TaxID=253161 RepID=UPI002616AEF3
MSKTEKKVDSFVVINDNDEFELVGAKILDRYSIKTDMDETGSKQLKTDGWMYDESLLEPLYDPYQLCELLELNSYHESCVDVISRDAAGISYDFVPVTGENEDDATKPKITTIFPKLETKINKLLYHMNYDRKATGYGALEIIRENKSKSRIVNIAHIPSYTLRRTRDGKRAVQRVAGKEVWFVLYGKNYDENNKKCDVHADTGKFHPYNSLKPEEKANELLWTMDYNPKSQYYGLPKIIGSIPTIYGDMSRNNYNTSFFKNYGMPAFAVLVSGDFYDYDEKPYIEDENGNKIPNPDYDVTETLRYKISQQLKEVIRNPHSAMAITIPSEGEEGNVDIKLQPLSVDTKEAGFRLYRKDNRDEILHTHRVPPYKLGINENGSLGGSNIREATVNYKNDVVAPIRDDDEFMINKILKDDFGIIDWEFKIIEHDNRDYAGDIAIIKELFNMASITPRQIIENIGDKFGLTAPDNPFLDEYYLNGQPLDNIWNDTPVSGEADEMLSSLENDLLGEAVSLDESIVQSEGHIGEDVIESASVKKDIKTFRQTISDAFRRRK